MTEPIVRPDDERLGEHFSCDSILILTAHVREGVRELLDRYRALPVCGVRDDGDLSGAVPNRRDEPGRRHCSHGRVGRAEGGGHAGHGLAMLVSHNGSELLRRAERVEDHAGREPAHHRSRRRLGAAVVASAHNADRGDQHGPGETASHELEIVGIHGQSPGLSVGVGVGSW